MSNKLARRNYRCKCKVIVEEYVWDNEIRDKQIECPKCKTMLGFDQIRVEKVVQITSIRTPTKNR